MSEFAKRVVTAAALLAVVAAALVLREAGITDALWIIVVAVAGVLAAWEWSGLLGLRRGLQSVYVAACALVAWGMLFLPSLIPEAVAAVFFVTLGLWGLALLRVIGVPFPATAERVFFGMLGLGAVSVAGSILVNYFGAFLWALLAVVVVADTAAYGFGRRYGKTALAPDISPGKTRAGLVGALLAVATVSLPIAWGAGLPPAAWFYFVCLALLTACFSVVGDLTVSLLKRRADVKDSGQLLPGHGGVLDRIDGLLAAVPVYILGISALQGVVTV